MSEEIGITLSVEPAFSHGYEISVSLRGQPMVEGILLRLEYEAPDQNRKPGVYSEIEPTPRERKVVCSPAVLSKSDVDALANTIGSLTIPLVSKCGSEQRDGTGHALQIDTTGYHVELVWGDELPEDLSQLNPIVRLLKKYAKEKGLD